MKDNININKHTKLYDITLCYCPNLIGEGNKIFFTGEEDAIKIIQENFEPKKKNKED